jgi:hypothetical protein
MKINLNTLAVDICSEEGKSKAVNIANMKETIGALGRTLRSYGLLKSLLVFVAIYKRAGK